MSTRERPAGLETSRYAVGAAGAAEDERESILSWLHDATLQTLEQMSKSDHVECPGCRRLVAMARAAAAELRAFVSEQWTPEAADPLAESVRRVVEDARRRTTQEIELAIGQTDGSVTGRPLTAIAGALREALANCGKHAAASPVTVYCEERARSAVVKIRDYGLGATPAQLESGLGVRHSIIERMRAAGGTASVESLRTKGLLVTLSTGAWPPR